EWQEKEASFREAEQVKANLNSLSPSATRPMVTSPPTAPSKAPMDQLTAANTHADLRASR
ncbi:unnamed protein product, partial [Musa textilis]